MRALGHIAVCAAALTALLGIPFIASGAAGKLADRTDAVSSASVIIDRPSGNYTVLINRSRHKSADDLEAWHEFFSGGDFAIIFDDIACVTLDGDGGALTMAQSFMSRLPENQMTVTSGEAVLVLSKAEYGRFDMMIVSDEAAEAYGIESVYEGKDVDVIRLETKGDTL